MQRECREKTCHNVYYTYSSLQTRCPDCQRKRDALKKKPRKPIAQRGERTILYEKWRDTIARPHLRRVYGDICQECGRRARVWYDDEGREHRENLDVAHIIGRGRDASQKMNIKNVRLLCRDCHRLETDGKL